MSENNSPIVPVSDSIPAPYTAIVPSATAPAAEPDVQPAEGPNAGASFGPASFTPEQRIGLVMACMPLVTSLRRRISVYSTIWCIAGFVIALLSVPALVSGHPYWAVTALIYGGSLLFFAAIRILESRTLAALTDVGRSGIRRKVWLGFNGTILAAAFIIFIVELCRPDLFAVWAALPCTIFVMIVSASPVWEWFFVHRVIANSKNLFADFCRSLGAVYPRPEESTELPLALEALQSLDRLQEKGALRPETFAAVRAELIGLTAPGAAEADATPASTKPW